MKVLDSLREIISDLNINITYNHSNNTVFDIILNFGKAFNKKQAFNEIIALIKGLDKTCGSNNILTQFTTNYNEATLKELADVINALPKETLKDKINYVATFKPEYFRIEVQQNMEYSGRAYPSTRFTLYIRNLTKLTALRLDKPYNTDYEIIIGLKSEDELVGSCNLVQKPSNCGCCQITRFKIIEGNDRQGIGSILLKYAEDIIENNLIYTLVECSGVAGEIESFLTKHKYTCYTRFLNRNSDNIVGHYFKNLIPSSNIEGVFAKPSGWYKENPNYDYDNETYRYINGDNDSDDE